MRINPADKHTANTPMSVTEDITGKVALVTGASKRIGAEIARVLHSGGMNLCLHYRASRQDAQTLGEELNGARANSAITAQADLLQTAALPGLIDACADRYGRLDLLVNNASAFYPTPIGQIREKDYDILLGSNVKAPLFLCQAAAAPLRRHRGGIINIIDIHAMRPMKTHIVYNIAKAGLLAMTKSLARVNGVAPGAVLWPEDDDNTDRQQRILARTALKRAGRPTDIAAAVLFLFRDAPYVTGHVLPVDGGRLLNV